MPCFSAHCLTALAISLRPRPAGRSGWVYTARMRWPARSSASSAGTAKAGVPAKMRFMQRPLHRQALLLFQFLVDARLFQAREVIDEDLAVEVIDFVLDAGGEQMLGLDLDRLALAVQRARPA